MTVPESNHFLTALHLPALDPLIRVWFAEGGASRDVCGGEMPAGFSEHWVLQNCEISMNSTGTNISHVEIPIEFSSKSVLKFEMRIPFQFLQRITNTMHLFILKYTKFI